MLTASRRADGLTLPREHLSARCSPESLSIFPFIVPVSLQNQRRVSCGHYHDQSCDPACQRCAHGFAIAELAAFHWHAAFDAAVKLLPRVTFTTARFQQSDRPGHGQNVEDTAFYCFNRFTSLNEVGGDPKTFGVSVETFHAYLQQQQNNWPHSQLTTSTHDTKRAEDVRTRLNLISEVPDAWKQTVLRWSKMNEGHRRNHLPDRNAEYLFYQTLVGAWPMSEERVLFYMEKSAHESKQHTTWANRNQAYETALNTFVSETLRDTQFTADLEHFIGTLVNASAVNSLAQTLIKLTAPGVPEIYQGCEPI